MLRVRDQMEAKMCPDMLENTNFFNVANSYSDEEYRESFSIEIWKCDKTHNKKCESDEEINRLLRSVYFTLYQVEERVQFDLKNKENQ